MIDMNEQRKKDMDESIALIAADVPAQYQRTLRLSLEMMWNRGAIAGMAVATEIARSRT